VTATAQRTADDALGRVPGRRPPLPAWAPLAVFVALATVLTVVVVGLVRPPGPLDQPDPAHQRDGLLRDGPVVDRGVAGVQFGGRPVVLLFDRAPPDPRRLAAWVAAVPDGADVTLVLPDPTTVGLPVPAVTDRSEELGAAVAMPVPVDGGSPVGYAVVDSNRVVRYATLDPDYLTNAFEVTTMVKAVR
jgi:hypothetical protein